jgi:DNA polymerase-3 subunit delta'
MNDGANAPWLEPYWRRLAAYAASERVPQALLIAGIDGVGKMRLACLFAQRLLCRRPGDLACGECVSCRLFAAQTHPDFLVVEPAEPGKPITVDAIRGLIATLSLKPQYSGYRVVILAPAHQMNSSAANSLLKTLEEPDEHTVMLLLTEAPAALPATVLSRCQRMDIAVPDRALSVRWLAEQGLGEQAEVLLALAQGAPFRAVALAQEGVIERREEFFLAWRDVARRIQEPVLVAEKWAKFSCEALTDWIASWVIDLIRLRALPNCAPLNNPDLRESLQATARQLELKSLFRFLDLLNATKRRLVGQINRQLALEELLIHWSSVDSVQSSKGKPKYHE